MQLYLESPACKYPCSVIEDSQFEQARQALEARSKELKKDGKGNKPKAAEAFTDEEVNILYNKQLLGISNAQAFLNTMWFMNTKHFGLRGCDEHRRMKWGDVQLLTDVNGAEHLEYSERQTKTRTAVEPRNITEQLNLKLTVSQTVHRTEIQCLFTKFTLRKDLAR